MFNTNLFFNNWGFRNPFVMAGGAVTIIGSVFPFGYSTNGTSWTGLTGSGLVSSYAPQVLALNYRNGIWVAGLGPGETSNRMLYSTNSGTSWDSSSTALSLFFQINTICSSTTTFVCGGARDNTTPAKSVLAYSTDGETWTTSASANTLFSGNSDAVNDICHDGTKFIAVGTSSSGFPIITSTDGITWTRSDALAVDFSTVCYNGSIYVAAGNSVLYTSTDAITWTSRAISAPGLTIIRTIAWNGSYFIAGGGANATGDSPVLSKSTDGINWTVINSGERQLYQVSHVNWDGIRWTASGQVRTIPSFNTPIVISTDGVTWVNSGNSQSIFGAGNVCSFSIPSPSIYPPVFS
jgi:hypothetical protein